MRRRDAPCLSDRPVIGDANWLSVTRLENGDQLTVWVIWYGEYEVQAEGQQGARGQTTGSPQASRTAGTRRVA